MFGLIPVCFLTHESNLQCVLTGVEPGASSQPLVSLLERPEHRVEQHLVSSLPCRIQELPRWHVVVSTWIKPENQREQVQDQSEVWTSKCEHTWSYCLVKSSFKTPLSDDIITKVFAYRRCGWIWARPEPAASTTEPQRSHRWPWTDAENTQTFSQWTLK